METPSYSADKDVEALSATLERRARIARSLRAARTSRGMTQRALAAMAHVWQTTVCRLERGTQPLTGEAAWLFADLLGTSVDDLVGRRAGHEAGEGETG